MKKRTAIILAGGIAKRFDSKVNKNLLKVDGRPLIARTIAQLKRRNIPTRILMRDPGSFIRAGIDRKLLVPTTDRWQTEGVLVSRPHWGRDQTLILFGDAYYSEACMDLFVEGKTMFYCSTAEIWGLSIDKKWYPRVIRTARKVIVYQAKHPAINENLWRFYYVWYGHRYDGGTKKTPGLGFRKAGTVIMVFDDTVDFDRPEEYTRWCRGLRGRQVKAPHRASLCKGRKIVEFIPGTDTWRCPITEKIHRGFLHCEPKGCPSHSPQR